MRKELYYKNGLKMMVSLSSSFKVHSIQRVGCIDQRNHQSSDIILDKTEFTNLVHY